jgi:CspA family cold shock protein
MATGTVKWFNYKKGYGFVTPDENGAKDIFVHITAVTAAGINNLQDGQKVSYEVESRQGKLSAINLKLA